MKFKIFSEKTKQKLGIKGSETDWKPTSNARNLAMIDEVRKFAQQLKLMHTNFTELEKNISGSLNTMKDVLASPLPRVYTLGENGPLPVDGQVTIVGHGVSLDVITSTGQDLKYRLQLEVLYPLEQWLTAYRSIKAQNVKCEELRLELDSKRRLAASLYKDVEKCRAKFGGGAASPPPTGIPTSTAAAEGADLGNTVLTSQPSFNSSGGASVSSLSGVPLEGRLSGNGSVVGSGTGAPGSKLEHAEAKYQAEEEKSQRLAQTFRDAEGEVYAAMLTLIRDTEVLKQYAGAGLLVYERSFRQAFTAFDTGSTPMVPGTAPTFPPGYDGWGSGGGVEALPPPSSHGEAKTGAAGGFGADSDDENSGARRV